MVGTVYSQDMLNLNAEASATALCNIQKVSLMRYSFKSALVQKGALPIILKFMEIFSAPLV